METKKRRILQRIHKTLSLDPDITKRNKQILGEVLDGLCAEMNKDPLFAWLFNRLIYTGSMYEGLRIHQADEFDVNLVMKLPVKEGDFQESP